MNGKTTTELELEDEAEEDGMTVYLKTISGKTISIKCDKKQKADTVSENWNEHIDPSRYNSPRSPRRSEE